MPRLLADDMMMTGQVGTFTFSAVKPDRLTEAEYTVVDILVDNTGSMYGFENAVNETLKVVVESCKKDPRSEKLLVRVAHFTSSVQELHGFLPLSAIDVNQYVAPRPHGNTALYDACYSGIGVVNRYAKDILGMNANVNGITFIITDGDDNCSKMRVPDVKQELKRGVLAEEIESHKAILIGVNASHYRQVLEDFSRDAELDQFVDIGQATAGNLAKLAGFVSKSISTQSQSLGTGGPSQNIVI